MKMKQSIVGTFFTYILIVLLSCLVILLALWVYRVLLDSASESSFFYYLTQITTLELSFIFLFALFTTLIVSKMMASDLKRHFKLFTRYFQDASKKLQKIDTSKLKFQEFESLALSVNEMVDTVKKSNEEVLQHKSYLQAVLEAQKNIVIVMEGCDIISVNKAFLNFFDVESLRSFYNKHEYLCDIFLPADGYIQCKMGDKEWKKFVMDNPTFMHKVKLKKGHDTYMFVVDVAEIKNGENVHLMVSFTNITELENERKLFEKAASTDALTGIANRLKFNTILEQQIALSNRYKEPFSLIIYDIDDFKRVNDTYGHHVGDEVLISLTQNVSKNIRLSDTFARWGGEEFGIILPQTSQKEAIELANKIRENIENLRFGEGFKLTCSFGVKEHDAKMSSELFIQEVDVLLYKAKSMGKNRVYA